MNDTLIMKLERIIDDASFILRKLKNINTDEEILADTICRYFQISQYDFKSYCRKSNCVAARQFYHFFAKLIFKNFSLERIANYTKRDHSTAIHNIKKITELLYIKDKQITENYHRIIAELVLKNFDTKPIEEYVRKFINPDITR